MLKNSWIFGLVDFHLIAKFLVYTFNLISVLSDQALLYNSLPRVLHLMVYQAPNSYRAVNSGL